MSKTAFKAITSVIACFMVNINLKGITLYCRHNKTDDNFLNKVMFRDEATSDTSGKIHAKM